MQSNFKPIPCGETLPIKNVHAVSVSMPTMKDVIGYEEFDEKTLEKIQSGYPRFIMHPYLKILAKYIEEKYHVDSAYELVLLSSQNAVKMVSDKYFIHNKIEIDEPFGVILVQRGTCQLQKVLMYIQHVGCNLSSRLAEEYLFEQGLIDKKHEEELLDANIAEASLINDLAKAYDQPAKNIGLAPSGMNAVYSVLRGLKNIQAHNGRTVLVQFGWLYLDTMNIVQHHFEESKSFYDITNLDALEKYLKGEGMRVSAIVTEVPTNPLLQCVDVERLKNLCNQYNIPLIIDSTLATPFCVDLKPYADIYIESLTKYACGNADVLMGCYVLNENSKLSFMKGEFAKHIDKPYIKDIQRMAYEVQGYEARMKIISANTKKLIAYLESCSYVDKVFHCMQASNKDYYKKLMVHDDAYAGLLSVTFTKPFEEVYDNLNFAKGPSLGTEFTLLMPYVYLAHYDYITSESGRECLAAHGMPIDLLRISIGSEDIDEIIAEFQKLEA